MICARHESQFCDTIVNKTDTKPCFCGPSIIKWGSKNLAHILESYIVSMPMVSALRKGRGLGVLWGEGSRDGDGAYSCK